VVGGFDILDLTQLVALGGGRKVIRVLCRDEEGVLVFENRALVHASTRDLQGEAAFFKLAQSDWGRFEELDREKRSAFPPNIERAMTHLLLEAARRRDEAARDRVADPSDATLETAPAPSDASPLTQAPAGNQSADRRREMVRQAAPSGESPWQDGKVVRVLVACPLDTDPEEVDRALARLAEALEATPSPVVFSASDPCFTSLRPAAGGALVLTIVTIRKRHAFLFETLAPSVDHVLIAAGGSGPDGESWLSWLPDTVSWAPLENPETGEWDLVGKLHTLAEETA
jgi:hypothetical protein